MMPALSLAIHILAINLIFLANQIQGGQFLQKNEEVIMFCLFCIGGGFHVLQHWNIWPTNL
jgi:hypothetical protein